MEDSVIIDLYLARDEEAIAQTQGKYGAYCGRIAGNILRNPEDVQEMLSDTWFAAWNAIPPRIPLKLAAFLGKITRRISINRLEKRIAAKRGGEDVPLVLDELSECIPAAGTPETELEGKELMRFLRRFVDSLPEEESQVFLLRYWYMEPIGKIAKHMNWTESKVASMLLRTRRRLKVRLEKEGYTL